MSILWNDFNLMWIDPRFPDVKWNDDEINIGYVVQPDSGILVEVSANSVTMVENALDTSIIYEHN